MGQKERKETGKEKPCTARTEYVDGGMWRDLEGLNKSETLKYIRGKELEVRMNEGDSVKTISFVCVPGW